MTGGIICLSLDVEAKSNDIVIHDAKEENKLGLVALKKLGNLGVQKKLLVFDLNGLLIHRAHRGNKSEIPLNRQPDGVYKQRLVYRRPFLEEFMKFCHERFEVGIWSSAKEGNVDGIFDCAFKGLMRSSFLFIWVSLAILSILVVLDQRSCTDSGFKSMEKKYKALFFKELKKLWQTSAPSKGGLIYSQSNTLLIDDEPYKGLLNPPNTGIYPNKYDAGNLTDDFLGYRFGQPAIGPKHPDWNYYSNVLNHAGGFLV
uniref:Mitochondrial import inner membrane translocase subunit TIM50 n=1 Tax=Chenopodium quinoa TaxID=63459 RepID=A0A803MZP8_CHEQI